MELLAEATFTLSTLALAASFVAAPACVFPIYLLRGKKESALSDRIPTVSIVIVARNAAASMEKIIKSVLALDYPADKREVIIFSDGSTDNMEEHARACGGKSVRVLSSTAHCGKIHGMNKAVKECSGELLVFTDADVSLGPAALRRLIPYFGDPSVGGVSGRKVVVREKAWLEEAQGAYMSFGDAAKRMESSIGSVASNDGVLYAIRRELYREIPPAVTDDLYVCLSIVRQNRRFLYEPRARAFMSAPSQDPWHELRRRRRIVSTSLRGILLSREVLNPFRYGVFALCLFFNRVLRRLIPVFLLSLFAASFALAPRHLWANAALDMQFAFYLLALIYAAVLQHIPPIPVLTKAASLVFYFCWGNFGALLGLIDLLRGKRISKW